MIERELSLMATLLNMIHVYWWSGPHLDVIIQMVMDGSEP